MGQIRQGFVNLLHGKSMSSTIKLHIAEKIEFSKSNTIDFDWQGLSTQDFS